MIRKTKLMLQAEERVGMPLEKSIPSFFNAYGLEEAARLHGVSKATFWYWSLKFGKRVRRIMEDIGAVESIPLPGSKSSQGKSRLLEASYQ